MQDTASARVLLMRAAAREAALDMRGALTLYSAAIAADSANVDTHAHYQRLSAFLDGFSARRRRYARWRHARDPLYRCLAITASTTPGHGDDAVHTLRALDSTTHPTACSAVFIFTQARVEELSAWGAERFFRVAVVGAPTMGLVWHRGADMRASAGDTGSARRTLIDGLAHVTHWRDSLELRVALLHLARGRADTAAARGLRSAIQRSAQRDERPGVRYDALQLLGSEEQDKARADALLWDAVGLALKGPAPQLSADLLVSLAAQCIDRGEPRSALPFLRQAVSIANSLHDRSRLAAAELRTGRALVKLDSLDPAERALHAARLLADRADDYFIADVEHNLAHLYESKGSWRRAVAAVDAFVTASASLPNDPISVIALRDAGIIHAKAHDPIGARRALDAMTGAIERQHANWLWAGEYFERAGELRRALTYYQRVPASSPSETARALAGATRIYTSLGLADSATQTARLHDAAPPTPEEVPLMAALLVREHHAREGVDVARRWRNRWRTGGNAVGDLRATIELASVLLEAGDPWQAVSESRAARALAKAQHDAEGRAIAGLIEGRALTALGDTSSTRVLNTALTTDSAVLPRHVIAALHTARAEAFRTAGQPDAALHELDVAARLVGEISGLLDVDLDRARIRDHWIQPFDAAIETLLAQPATASRIAELLAWSERRRQLVMTVPRPEIALHAVQRALERGEVLIDYIVLDSAAAAIVITRSAARVVSLPATGRHLADQVARFRRSVTAVFGGRIDTVRARLDLSLAHDLFREILGPAVNGIPERKLRIVTDGALQLVPFDALVTSNGRVPRFVLDDYEVAFLADATPDTRPRISRGYGTLAVLGDVPGGVRELAAVRSSHVSGPVVILDGARITPATLVRRAAHTDVLHLATHAVVNASDPNASMLELDGHNVTGGRLRLSDLSHATLRARVVMLSGCETAAGPVLRGAGAMSLARAFLAAGAEHVVATQWPVGEQAALLMTPFYAALRDGASVASALRRAKRDLRSHAGASSPLVWAPFVLTYRLGQPFARDN